jgi:hypothetical protein
VAGSCLLIVTGAFSLHKAGHKDSKALSDYSKCKEQNLESFLKVLDVLSLTGSLGMVEGGGHLGSKQGVILMKHHQVAGDKCADAMSTASAAVVIPVSRPTLRNAEVFGLFPPTLVTFDLVGGLRYIPAIGPYLYLMACSIIGVT